MPSRRHRNALSPLDRLGCAVFNRDAPPPRDDDAESPGRDEAPAPDRADAPTPKPPTSRLTVTIDPALHRRVRTWAVHSGADLSALVSVHLERLTKDFEVKG